jgi:hypothetical protein
MTRTSDALQRAVGLVAALDEREGPAGTYTEDEYQLAVKTLLADTDLTYGDLVRAMAALTMMALAWSADAWSHAHPDNPRTARQMLSALAAQL